MREKPLVSIITPTYNHEKYIAQCIGSVLSQTYTNWEMIIIDDGSTDKTPDIIARYDDERIKYFRQENKGIWRLKDTYNKALKYAKGELVAILEGDDFWPPDKLEKQVPSFENKNVVLSFGIGGVTDIGGKVNRYYPPDYENFTSLSSIDIFRKLMFKNFIVASTVMCRKRALVSIGGFKQESYTPYVDYCTWLELGLVGKYCFVNKVLGFWRRHSAQTTQRMRVTMSESGMKCSEGFFRKLPYTLKKSLGISLDEIHKYRIYKLSEIYFHEGRRGLYKRDWKYARDMFQKSFKYGFKSLKLKSLGGIALSLLHIDMEWLNNLFEMPPLQEN